MDKYIKEMFNDVRKKVSSIISSLNKKTEINLLWTNPNPTSSFAAQTVSLNLSGYDMVEIAFYQATSQLYTHTKRVLVGCVSDLGVVTTRFLETSGTSTSGTWSTSRQVNVKTTGITFGAGAYEYTYNNGNNHVVNNSYTIPLKIYGIKLGGVVNHRFFRRWFGC